MRVIKKKRLVNIDELVLQGEMAKMQVRFLEEKPTILSMFVQENARIVPVEYLVEVLEKCLGKGLPWLHAFLEWELVSWDPVNETINEDKVVFRLPDILVELKQYNKRI